MAGLFNTDALGFKGQFKVQPSNDGNSLQWYAGSTLVMQKSNTGEINIDTSVSSLQATDVANKSDTESDVSSLHAQDITNESDLSVDISSLQSQRTSDESETDQDISSLHAVNAEDTTDISSLHAQDTKNESDLSVDVSSLQAQDVKNESDLSVDISSLQSQDVKNESDLSVDISSLQAQDVKNESDLSVDISSLQSQRTGDENETDTEISSLHAAASLNDVKVCNIDCTTANGLSADGLSMVVTFSDAAAFGENFASTPALVAMLNRGSSDGSAGMHLSALSSTSATFQFSAEMSSSDSISIMSAV